MGQALKAGSLYFAFALALGFGGALLREGMLKLGWGMLTAVLAEMLFLLLPACWVACRWLVKSFEVPATLPSRLAMGGLALALLLVGETLLAKLIYGASPTDYLEAQVTSPSGIAGLIGQGIYVLFPAVRLMADSPNPPA